ncbi:hypothetical protein BD779DRAFT_352558 [Infundibulicybe gibba]|nr:hypothetical protein BD779DRAFT_352558 [Infundibulicybe gibba]
MFTSIWAPLDIMMDISMLPVAEELGFIKISSTFERQFLQLSLQDTPSTTTGEAGHLGVAPAPPDESSNSIGQPPRPVRAMSPSTPSGGDKGSSLRFGLNKLILPSPDEMDKLGRLLFDETTLFEGIAREMKTIQREKELCFGHIANFTTCLLKNLQQHRGATKIFKLTQLISYYTQIIVDAPLPLQQ